MSYSYCSMYDIMKKNAGGGGGGDVNKLMWYGRFLSWCP